MYTGYLEEKTDRMQRLIAGHRRGRVDSHDLLDELEMLASSLRLEIDQQRGRLEVRR